MRPTCPVCGSERLQWTLHRDRTGYHSWAQRHLEWKCESCGHSWIEPVLEQNPLVPPERAT